MGTIEVRLGRAGSGKSTQIAEEIERELAERPMGPKIFWLVPVENSYAAERMLMGRLSSSLRAEVIHLHRLAQRTLPAVSPFGKAINATGKRLLLASVYRQARPKLKILRRDVVTVSFLDSILEAFQELTQNLVPLDQLEGALESAAARIGDLPVKNIRSGRSLLGKLADLSYLYIQFKQALNAAGFADPDELLTKVEPYLAAWQEIRGATVYIDGFSDLTPQELRFIMTIAENAERTVITLSMDASWAASTGSNPNLSKEKALGAEVHGTHGTTQFHDGLLDFNAESIYAPQTLLLYQRILAACSAADVRVTMLQRDHGSYRFQDSPNLEYLEQRLYEDPVMKREGTLPRTVQVGFAAAQNPRAEAQGVAEEIRRLVREEPLRFQDIVVLVPSLDEYSAYLRDSFERYEIPFYMDVFPSFAQHPLAKFILAAMHVIQGNFSTESLIRLLKSDFCGLERNQADWLETYLRRFEVQGKAAWLDTDEWNYAANQNLSGGTDRQDVADVKAEKLRQVLIAYLAPFADRVNQDLLRPMDLSYALWELVKAVDAKQSVAMWMVNEDASLSPMEASMHEQAWQKTVELLNDLASFQDESAELPKSFLFELLEHHILNQTLNTIPARLGDVFITEVHRSNALECEVGFILGVLDGSVPHRMDPHGLLQDEERLQFARLFGQRLGYTTEELQLCQRLIVYTAFTRARRFLHLSYPLADSSGKGMSPSQLLSRVRHLFDPDGVKETLWIGAREDGRELDETQVFAPQTAMDILVSSLRSLRDGGLVHPLSAVFLKWARGQTKWAEMLNTAISGWQHETRSVRLESRLAAQLYHEPLAMTVYQIESFAACPFQHFVQFGLKVQPEESPDVTQTARGRLMHDAILHFVQAQQQNWPVWQGMNDEEAQAAMHQVFLETMSMPSYVNWTSRALRTEQAAELLNILSTAARVLARHAKYSSFSPAALELAFGTSSSSDNEVSLPAMVWKTKSGREVHLRGRIDRVDVVLAGEQVAFRLFDYKSSKRDLDFTQIEYGLGLQLPVYAAVVEHFSEMLFGSPGKPAGLFYLPIYQEWKTGWTPMDAQKAQQSAVKTMRARGVFVNEPSFIEWMDSRFAKGEDSDLFGKVYNKDQQIARNTPIVSQEDFRAMIRRALSHVEEIGDRILVGENAITPAQVQGKNAACAFCPYSAICHIDRRLDSRKFRKLPKLDREQLISSWQQAATADRQN